MIGIVIYSVFVTKIYRIIYSHISLVIFFLFLAVYCAPLLQKNQLIGALGANADANIYLWQMTFYCSRISSGNLITYDFYPSTGTDFSGGYFMPFLNSIACPFSQYGPVFMLNLIIVVQIILIASVFYIFLKRYVTSKPILLLAFLFLYTFSTFFVNRVSHHMDIVSILWILPLVVLAWHKSLSFTLQSSILLGFVYSVAVLSSWQNINLLMPPTIVFSVIICLTALRKKKTKQVLRITNAFLISSFTFVIFALPLSLPLIRHKLHSDIATDAYFPLLESRNAYSADVASLFLPLEQNVLFKTLESVYSKINANGISIFESHSSLDPLSILVFLSLPFALFLSRKRLLIKQQKYILVICLLIGVAYFIIASWTAIRFLGIEIIKLPIIARIYNYFPLNMTRTPGRLVFGSYFFFTIISFWLLSKYIETIKRKKIKIFFEIIVLIYSICWTIFFNRNYQLVTHNPYHNLPAKGLEMIRLDQLYSVVLPIPISPSVDSRTNVLQLMHRKPQLSGFFTAWVYEKRMIEPLLVDPVLSHLGCDDNEFSFSKKVDLNMSADEAVGLFDWKQVYQHLKKIGVKYLIINYGYLSKYDECTPLLKYGGSMSSQTAFFEVIDVTSAYTVLRLK